MKKISFLIMMILISSINYAQNCDCSSNLKWLIETLKKNDAGFQYVIDKKGKSSYIDHNNNFLKKAESVSSVEGCHILLKDWSTFFRKGHLYINIVNDTIHTEIYKNSFNSLKDFKKYISKTKDNFEGIWSEPNYKIAIIKDNARVDREYVGYILSSNDSRWKTNEVKIEIFKNNNNKYNMNYYVGNHHKYHINNIDITSDYITGYFVVLKKLKKDTNLSKERYFKSMFAQNPFFEKITTNTAILRIPSFNYNQKNKIDSILKQNDELIKKTDNLIIDLRNNGGGSDASYKNILPYLYTNPIRIVGAKFLSTKLNNQKFEKLKNNPSISDEDRKWFDEALSKLNKHIGEFVNFNKDVVRIDTLNSILHKPKNIAILINSGCGSTTEQFLLAAKQSKKVKLYGETTEGVLDISNMNNVIFPSKIFELWYGTSLSQRVPMMTIDEKGIQPDFYFDKTIKPYEWIDKTIEIQNYE